jgi:hypothetical protein
VHFFVAMAKTTKIRRIFSNFSFDSLIDTVNFSVYRWIDGHESEKAFMIDCRYYRSKIKKIFNRWIYNIDENETKSIDQ